MTSAVCRLKALRGKPKAKHIESELLSAVVRTHHPRVVEAQLGERGDLSAAKCSAFQDLLR